MLQFLPTYTNYTTRVLGEGAKLASWHLQQLATEPCTQRQGLAKALVQAVEVMVRCEILSTVCC
jgi:ribosomal protein S18 acetylase RimI-like enzyme